MVMIVIALVCLPFTVTRLLFVGLLSVCCCWEMCINFDRQLGIKVAAWVVYLFIVVQVVLALTKCGTMAYYAWFTFAVCLAMFSGIVNKDVSGHGTIYTLAALAYPGVPASMSILICASARAPQALALAAIPALTSDTFALFGGKLFGKHKLAPSVSPNKTVEGSISGCAGGLIAGVIVWLVSKRVSALPLVPCLVTSLLASIASQIGDLAESLLKRYIGVKDFSNLIPGHGGALDRMDSCLFAIPAAYFCLYMFGL